MPLICPIALIFSMMAGAPIDSPQPPGGYVCGRVDHPLVIDGKLDDPGWSSVPWTDDFVDIEGDLRPRPRFRTRAKMAWDETYFYVAAELTEPHVWGTLTRHDSVIFQDNDFEVFIDPDGDNHNYFELELNALNTEWDLLLEKPYRDGGPAVDAWEIPGLKSATHVLGTINDPQEIDQGWTLELAIPWKALQPRANRPTPPADGDQWRVNFSRVEWEHQVEGLAYVKSPARPEANWVWSSQGVVDMHRPERWGYVQFSDKPPGQDTYHPDPSALVRDRLMAIYQAQRAFEKKNKSWSGSLEPLGLAHLPPLPGATPAQIHLTPQGFEAEITLQGVSGRSPERWTVQQDSQLQKQPTGPRLEK